MLHYRHSFGCNWIKMSGRHKRLQIEIGNANRSCFTIDESVGNKKMEQNDKILLLLAYVVGISLISFILMGIDKHRARKKAWRISKRTLFLVAICGGGIGGTLGM